MSGRTLTKVHIDAVEEYNNIVGRNLLTSSNDKQEKCMNGNQSGPKRSTNVPQLLYVRELSHTVDKLILYMCDCQSELFFFLSRHRIWIAYSQFKPETESQSTFTNHHILPMMPVSECSIITPRSWYSRLKEVSSNHWRMRKTTTTHSSDASKVQSILFYALSILGNILN